MMTESAKATERKKYNNANYNEDDGGEGGVLLATTMLIW